MMTPGKASSRRRGAVAARSMLMILVTVAAGCRSGGTEPVDGEDVRISLARSGGIAGTDRQFTIDGASGVIIGDRCAPNSGCDWGPGEILAQVSEAAVTALAARLRDLGLFTGPSDFGVQCCDRFAWTIAYEDDDLRRTVTGDDGTLPERMLDVIAEIEAFFEAATAP